MINETLQFARDMVPGTALLWELAKVSRNMAALCEQDFNSDEDRRTALEDELGRLQFYVSTLRLVPNDHTMYSEAAKILSSFGWEMP